MRCARYANPAGARAEETMKNGYLLAAYVLTWVIHIGYVTTIVVRYGRLKGEVAALGKK